jgi:hypothetical protein
MNIYLVSRHGRSLTVAYENDEVRLHAYVENTGKFHYSAGLSSDFYVGNALSYELITLERTLGHITAGIGHIDVWGLRASSCNTRPIKTARAHPMLLASPLSRYPLARCRTHGSGLKPFSGGFGSLRS